MYSALVMERKTSSLNREASGLSPADEHVAGEVHGLHLCVPSIGTKPFAVGSTIIPPPGFKKFPSKEDFFVLLWSPFCWEWLGGMPIRHDKWSSLTVCNVIIIL